MRALLVQAPSVEGPTAEIVAPLGLALVAESARSHGHPTELLDLNLVTDPLVALHQAMEDYDPDVVGLGLRNIDPLANRRHSYLPVFGALVELVRRLKPEVPLVVGGAGFSMFPGAIMERYPALDLGVVLEGEETFPAVLDRLEACGQLDSCAGLAGTILRCRGEGRAGSAGLVFAPGRARLAASSLDRPRTWLPSFAARYQGLTNYAPAAGVETKRGCPLSCSYCVYPALQGRRLRFRSPETIADEIELLYREAGIEWVHFTDPVLNFPRDHFRALCRALIERRLPVRWTGFFREDVLGPEEADLAVSAGCACFQFSGDGTCERTLHTLRKGLSLEDILAAARAAAGTDALSIYHFMVNVPGTDQHVAADARSLVERLHEIHGSRANLGAIVFNNLRVYPGTPLEQALRASGAVLPEAELLFPVYHDPEPYSSLRYELEVLHQRLAVPSVFRRVPDAGTPVVPAGEARAQAAPNQARVLEPGGDLR